VAPINFADTAQPVGCVTQLYRDYREDGSKPSRAFARAFIELVRSFPKLTRDEYESTTRLWWDFQIDVDGDPEISWDAVCGIVRNIGTSKEQGEPEHPKSKAAPPRAGHGKRRRRPPRIPWDWGPAPRRILRDPSLSAHAKLVAAVIADSINLGKWNKYLVARMSYAELAKRASLSRRGAINAVVELADADTGRGPGTKGYVSVKSLGRGGCEFQFRVWLNRTTTEDDIEI